MLVHKIEICIKSILDKKLQKAAIVRGSRALLAGAWQHFFRLYLDVTCVISWVVAFAAGCHSKLASPFSVNAGVILNKSIIIWDKYI